MPLPVSVARRVGEFVLDEPSSVGTTSATAERARRLLREQFGSVAGFAFADGGADAAIRLESESALRQAEAYRLEIDDRGVVIRANDEAGFIFGVQTLRQLLPADAFALGPVSRPWVVPAVEIVDAPRHSWRGVMLDVARHFIPIASLFRFVDEIAALKLNVLHLHLNDDQGWRFPSESYPRLVEVHSGFPNRFPRCFNRLPRRCVVNSSLSSLRWRVGSIPIVRRGCPRSRRQVERYLRLRSARLI